MTVLFKSVFKQHPPLPNKKSLTDFRLSDSIVTKTKCKLLVWGSSIAYLKELPQLGKYIGAVEGLPSMFLSVFVPG